jgi:hypothetical protein
VKRTIDHNNALTGSHQEQASPHTQMRSFQEVPIPTPKGMTSIRPMRLHASSAARVVMSGTLTVVSSSSMVWDSAQLRWDMRIRRWSKPLTGK